MLRYFARLFSVCAAAGLWLSAAAADLPDPAELLARIDAGDHQAVFEELAPRESDFAGLPRYDYLFGVAAVRSGEVNLGAFALERVLVVSPDHIGAAMEIAQTDILLGDPAAGLKKLRTLIARDDVPDNIRNQAAVIVVKIEQAAQARALAAYRSEFGWHGKVIGGLGYTDNAIYRADADSYLIDFFGRPLEFESGKRPGATYVESEASLEYRAPVGERFYAAAGARVFSRDHFSDRADASDYRAGGPFFVFGAAAEGRRYEARIFAERVATDNEWRHDLFGASFSMLAPISRRFALRAALGYQALAARRGEPDKKIPSATLGLIWAVNPDTAAHFLFAIADERNEKPVTDGDRSSAAAIAALVHNSPQWKPVTFMLSVSRQSADYERRNFLFDRRRKDDTVTVSAGLDWKLAQSDIIIAPKLSYANARSNIPTNTYTRREGLLSLRYEF